MCQPVATGYIKVEVLKIQIKNPETTYDQSDKVLCSVLRGCHEHETRNSTHMDIKHLHFSLTCKGGVAVLSLCSVGFQGMVTIKRGQDEKGARLPISKLNYLRNTARKTWHKREQHLKTFCLHRGPAFPLPDAL